MATTTTKTAPAASTTGAGVKKGGRAKGGKKNTAFSKMQAFFSKHRAEHKHLSFGDQQKELGKQWKVSPENPKNQAAAA